MPLMRMDRLIVHSIPLVPHRRLATTPGLPVPMPRRSGGFFRRDDVAFIFHLAALLFYIRTWVWHTSEAALGLPGASGFGWFFRYLTFCSYTLQLVQLFFCCLAHVTKVGLWPLRG